jgi:hypothetical protein
MGWIQTALHTVLALYGLGFMATLVLLENATIEHGFMSMGTEYGRFYSERHASIWSLALRFTTLRFLLFLVLCQLTVYRNTKCGGCSCVSFWYALAVALAALDLVALALLGTLMAGRNSPAPAQRFNPANDYRRCCDPRVYQATGSNCPVTSALACPSGIRLEQMQANPDFVWLLAINVATAVGALGVILGPPIMWATAEETWPDKERS